MRIGINCLRISPFYKGGVNSFTFGLLDGFAQCRRRHKFVIFANENNQHLFEPYLSARNFDVVEVDEARRDTLKKRVEVSPRPLRTVLRRLLPPRMLDAVMSDTPQRALERGADILFVPYCPPQDFPFPDRPTMYSIHDLQHVHYPEFFSPKDLEERDIIFANCTRHAALIQASSEQMRDDFLANLPALTPQKIVVIQEGVNIEIFRRPRIEKDIRRKYGLPGEFLFFPAQLWHHKNHITVLKALARLKAKGILIPLVLSGARYEGSERLFDFIAEQGLSNQVFYLGVVPFEDVIALHQAAKFLITAVLYESSSIPILEAAAAGTAVIASETPANLERARDLQLNLFPPTDEAALADLLEKIWPDDALRAAQSAHNASAIAQFDWSRIAENYLDAFEAFMARRK